MADPVIHRSRFDDLRPRDLYDILRLRSEIFVVEQDCVFLDLDGRDHEPDALHLWIRDDLGVVAAVRILDPGTDRSSIGRVVTRADARSSGAASTLMRAAVDDLERGGAPTIHLGAQAHLADWYGRFGFEISGPGYDEDGIPHVPMTRHTTLESSS
ncbi:GNAT family N-acetyltransferase [Actinospongicola halichondriae]|uniref:GNAT family N-acetyltransferase n=1 Tax=Actinospongicola halichondriae TaxID=3236844 RepID=UPI003D51B3B1